MKKILVVGSEGQIGSHLCSYLENCNFSVDRLDISLNNSHDLTLQDHLLGTVNSKFQNAEFVFFLAFDVGGSKYLKKEDSGFNLINNNIRIMKTGFECLKINQIPFIFASSQMSNMFHTNYGLLKKIGEKYTQSLNGITVRFWNVYGPELNIDKNKRHVISDFVESALIDKKIQILTDGKEERQFLHVEDSSKALKILFDNYEDLCHTNYYDITTGIWTSIEKVANIIAKITDSKVFLGKEKDLIQGDYKNSPTNDIHKYWFPEITIEDGIQKIVDFYKKENFLKFS